MADSAIVFSWGQAFVGREDLGLGVFMEALEYNKQLQQSKKIESFQTYIHTTGNVTDSSGTMVVNGTSQQIQAVLQDEKYNRIIAKAAHVVGNFSYATADTGEAIPGRIERLQAARKELGITKM